MKSVILTTILLITMLFGTTDIFAQDVELTIKFDRNTCEYGVYARPDFTNSDFFVAGGSQITIVVPESITNSQITVTSVAGGPWADSSQIYAPASASSLDFHAISSNGAAIDLTAGEETLLFTFTLPDTCCAPGVRLFNNGSDPDSSDAGMAGGDFNNYFADAFFLIDYYDSNFDNEITIDPPTGDTVQVFCAIDEPTVASLVTNEEDVIWYDAATGGNVVTPSTALTDDTIYYGAIEAGTCASAGRFAVSVSVNDAATPTGSTTQNFCAIDGPTVADLVAGGGTVTWYDAATGGDTISSGTALADGETYYGSLTDGDCESAVRLVVNVNVDDAPTPTGDAAQGFCEIENPTVNDLVTDEGSVTWYTAAQGGSTVSGGTSLVDGNTYYGSLTDAGSGCESSVRLAVTVSINDAPAPTGEATQYFCAIDNPTVDDLVTDEASVTWYTLATGGSIIAGGTALVDGSVYYGSLAAGSCSSASRLEVTANINDPAAPTTTDASQEFCSYANPTLTDVQINEDNITWYAADSGGSVLPLATALQNNTIYYASYTDTDSGCESTERLAVTVTLTDVCDVILNVKVMLQGALLGAADNLMRDNLNIEGYIPLTQPYSSTLNTRFTQVDNDGDETTTNTVLNSGSGTADAIVDWVFIEIRDEQDESTVIKTVSALVQRDGDVVAADGGSLLISNLPGTFYVSVKHRNHFGAMAATPLTVTGAQASVDFTVLTGSGLYSFPGYSSNVSMATVGGTRALYAGNVNYDIRIKYDGVANDRQSMGSQVLNHPENSAAALNFANATGYLSGDINMDGKVLYDGASNDRALLQNIVINYPDNTSDLNNFNNMIEQIPQ